MYSTHTQLTIIYLLNDLGNENEAERLVDNTNLNAVDESGNSALLIAADRGNKKEITMKYEISIKPKFVIKNDCKYK